MYLQKLNKNISKMLFKIFTYICAVFLHWVGHFVILVAATFPRKEAFLAHIKVEAFQAAVSESAS